MDEFEAEEIRDKSYPTSLNEFFLYGFVKKVFPDGRKMLVSQGNRLFTVHLAKGAMIKNFSHIQSMIVAVFGSLGSLYNEQKMDFETKLFADDVFIVRNPFKKEEGVLKMTEGRGEVMEHVELPEK